MIGIKGRIQREGEVVHVVARELFDLSAELASVGERETGVALSRGWGNEFHHSAPDPDPRSLSKPRSLVDAYRHFDQIKVKARNFR